MTSVLRPFVYWGQSNEKVFVKVDIKDVQDPDIDFTNEKLTVRAYGHGMKGKNNYELDIEFYLEIDAGESSYHVTDRYIQFRLAKVGKGEVWPRLTFAKEKYPWLKVDFDHLSYEGESEEDAVADEEQVPGDMNEYMKQQIDKALISPSTVISTRTLYLFFYNMFQWVGFMYIFVVLCLKYASLGEESKSRAHEFVGRQFMVVQVAAILEVLHPLLGWVKGDIVACIAQVFGRGLILFGLIAQDPKLQAAEVVWWLYGTWSAIELVRYPYYLLQVVKREVGLITWLRYTLWIPLYPLGFILEGLVMMLALRRLEQSDRWSLHLPNQANVSFHFSTFLQIYMLLFLIGATVLMRHMYEQRKKKLGPSVSPSPKSSKLKAN